MKEKRDAALDKSPPGESEEVATMVVVQGSRARLLVRDLMVAVKVLIVIGIAGVVVGGWLAYETRRSANSIDEIELILRLNPAQHAPKGG